MQQLSRSWGWHKNLKVILISATIAWWYCFQTNLDLLRLMAKLVLHSDIIFPDNVLTKGQSHGFPFGHLELINAQVRLLNWLISMFYTHWRNCFGIPTCGLGDMYGPTCIQDNLNFSPRFMPNYVQRIYGLQYIRRGRTPSQTPLCLLPLSFPPFLSFFLS